MMCVSELLEIINFVSSYMGYYRIGFRVVCSNFYFLHLQNLKEPPNVCLPDASRVSFVRMDSHDSRNLSIDSPVKDCRKIFLEQMYQSLKTEGGLQDCIQDALLSHTEGDFTSTKRVSATPELHVSSTYHIICIGSFLL